MYKLIILFLILYHFTQNGVESFGLYYRDSLQHIELIQNQSVTHNVFGSYVNLADSTGHLCSGVIISDKHVLTAASCLCPGKVYKSIEEITVEAGNDDESLQKHQTKATLCHPDYEKDEVNGPNIGLLAIDGAFEFNEKISEISIDPEGNGFEPSKEDVEVTLNIWDRSLVGKTTRYINFDTITIHPAVCEYVLNPPKKNGAMMNKNDICLIKHRGKYCMCDIGAPVMAGNALVGILTKTACHTDLPTVYIATGLPQYIPWIEVAKEDIFERANYHGYLY